MDKVRELIASARAAFGRLSEQEQFMVLAGIGAGMLVILVLAGLGVSSAIGSAEKRVKAKSDQLAQVLQLEGEYRARKAEHESRIKELERSNVRLVSLVEDVARQSGVVIGQLRPEDGEPSEEGVIESRVDLRAAGLSADRLQDFLAKLEASPGLVVVRRLKVDRPYKKDTVDIEMTVTTYKIEKK